MSISVSRGSPTAGRDTKPPRIWLAGVVLNGDGMPYDHASQRWVNGIIQAATKLGYAIETEDHDQENPTPYPLPMREFYAVRPNE